MGVGVVEMEGLGEGGCGGKSVHSHRFGRSPSQSQPSLPNPILAQTWVTERGVTDITERPQPAFATIKRFYRHGLLGRAKDGSVVELECLAQLPRSFPQILRAGVTEEALLLHLYFSYEYVFKVVDRAPLPGGKTYKIVDLSALSLPDLRSEGFRFISKASCWVGDGCAEEAFGSHCASV